jgi:hypothetical protein
MSSDAEGVKSISYKTIITLLLTVSFVAGSIVKAGGARAGVPTVLTKTLILTSANNGQIFSNYRITTSIGDCAQIIGATNVTIEDSDIGPCGGRGIYIVGGTGNNVLDSYIHVQGAGSECCDTYDGILVKGGSYDTIQGNVVAYSESNIEVFGSNISITGNFLLNPQGAFPRGQQIQTGAGTNITIKDNFLVSTRDPTLGPAIGTFNMAPILMSQGSRGNPPEDSINIYTTQHVDIENNYVTGGLDATIPGSGGAQSSSGCGILGADSDKVQGANDEVIKHNIVVNTGQCGIGIATGVNQAVIGNKVLNLNPNTGGDTAIYIWKQYKPPCGPVLLNGNVAYELKSGGGASGYWNGGGCAPVTCDGANVNVESCNMFDHGNSRTAQKALLTDPAVVRAPLIPPRPRNCVATSPYSTQSSLAPCSRTIGQ